MNRTDRSRRLSQSPFKGRDAEIEYILTGQAAHLLNIHGVGGIGKSRLLGEFAQRLLAQKPRAVMIQLDLQDLPPASAARPQAFLRALLEQEAERLEGTWRSVEQVATDTVRQLNRLASDPMKETPVYLCVDTTEQVQEDMEFWNWMEDNLVGPLVLAGKVRQIFAGRVPVPWRRFEARRAVELLSLGPLSPEMAGRDLLAAVLESHNPALTAEQMEKAVSLLADLSFGHPLLSEELATAAGPLLPKGLEDPAGFQRKLSQEVVSSFVRTYLFRDIDPPWPDILEWASVLHKFDPLLLRYYLEKLDRSLVAERQEYFFIHGLAMLRRRDAIVWNVGEGTALHGILRDILRRNLQVVRSDDFERACYAAAAVYRELAAQFAEESNEAEQCLSEAEHYEQEACQSAAHKEGK